MAIPSFQTLYDAAKAVITSDPDHTLTDFSDGSWLDAFAGVAAGASQEVARFTLSQVRRFFRSTATDDDLDELVRDLFGDAIVRNDGESDDDFNARVDEYISNALVRGTPPALRWLLNNRIDGIEPGSVEVDEDVLTGITTLRFTASDGESVALITDAINAELDSWRAIGRGVNVSGSEAA